MGRDQKDGIVRDQQVESPGQWGENAQCESCELSFLTYFYLFIWLYQMAWGISSHGLIAPGHVGSEFPTRD